MIIKSLLGSKTIENLDERLQNYLPENTLFYLKKWMGERRIHIEITRNRVSKLGDYCKISMDLHRISLNASMSPFLFFFVFTHELAHLLAIEKFGSRIAPHGKEWKHTFREMLLDSLGIYPEDLRPLIVEFSKSPKANFMASPHLVKYFRGESLLEDEIFIEELSLENQFVYNGKKYKLIDKRRKNFLCENLENGKQYIFQSAVAVRKI